MKRRGRAFLKRKNFHCLSYTCYFFLCNKLEKKTGYARLRSLGDVENIASGSNVYRSRGKESRRTRYIYEDTGTLNKAGSYCSQLICSTVENSTMVNIANWGVLIKHGVCIMRIINSVQ